MKASDPSFVDWLEAELKRELAPVVARRQRASRPRYLTVAGKVRARRISLLGGASTALIAKIASGLTVAAFAVGATGTALAGTANPRDWRQQVGQRVEECQAGLSADGGGGIAGCVGVFAGRGTEQAQTAPPRAAGDAPASEARENPGPPPPAGKITVIPKPVPTVAQPVPARTPVRDANRRPPLPEHQRGQNPSGQGDQNKDD